MKKHKLYIMQPGDRLIPAGSDGERGAYEAHCLTAAGKRIPWGKFCAADSSTARRLEKPAKGKRRAAKAKRAKE